MSTIRVLVGTRKGAFILTSDGSASAGRWAGRTLPGGKFITSRVRPWTRTGSMRRIKSLAAAGPHTRLENS